MTHVLIERMGWVLIHSLWQFALLSLLSGVVAMALTRRSAQSRYLLHTITMAGFVVSSLATWFLARIEVPLPIAQAELTDLNPLRDALIQGMEPIRGEFVADTIGVQSVVTQEHCVGAETSGTGFEAVPEFVSSPPNLAHYLSDYLQKLLRPWLSWIVVSWSLGVVLLSMRPLVGWHMLRRLRRLGVSAPTDEIRAALCRVAKQMGLRRTVDVMLSSIAQVPVVVGYFTPVILLPVAFALSVPLSQLEAILAHELAHVRRHDFVVNLLQTLIETVFFYHPAVWWLSHRIRVEREHCCDDLAVSVLNDRIEYGRALVRVEELRGRSTVLAMSAADGSLLSRVRRIVGVVSDRSDLNTRWPVLFVGLIMLAVILKLTVGSTGATMAANVPSESQENESGKFDDEAADGPEALGATSGESKYIAELSDGRSVEFVGITKNTRPAADGWRPDGLPIGQIADWPSTIVLHNRNSSSAYIPNSVHPDPDDDALDLLFRFRGLRAQPSINFDLPANGSSYHHLPVKDPYELRVSMRRRGEAPTGATRSPADGVVRIGLTDEPWGKWLRIDDHGQVLNPLNDEDLYRSHYEKIQIVRVEPHERTPDKKVLMLRQPKDRSGLYDFEMRGVDAEGKIQWVLEHQSKGAADPELREELWGLASPETKPLVRYEFRLRPYRHSVIFKGITLEPGKATAVSVSATLTDVTLPRDPLLNIVSLRSTDISVHDALRQVAQQAGLALDVNRGALNQIEVDVDRHVSIDLSDVPLQQVLGQLLPAEANPQVMRQVHRGKLIVTSWDAWLARTAEHLPEWLKPLQHHGSVAMLDENDQVDSLLITGPVNADLMQNIKTLPYLTKLELSSPQAESPDFLKQLSELPKLETLTAVQVKAAGVDLGDEIIRSLLPVKSLRTLSLSECGTTDAGARLLGEMPQLKSLNFYQEGKLTDDALKSIRRLSQLESLSLTSYVGTKQLGWMRFSTEGTRLLSRLKQLKSLQLVGHEVTAETLELPNLVSLGLGHQGIDDTVAAKVAELKLLRNLDLNYCSITDEGMKAISALPELRRLDLSSLLVTDAGLEPLGASKHLTHVTLRAPNVSDATLRQLARVKTLQRLDLYGGVGGIGPGNQYSIDGLLSLKGLPDLRVLWMTNMDLAAGSYSRLAELSHLAELTMAMCNITEQELDAIEIALPNARISHLTGGGSWLPKKEKRRLLAPVIRNGIETPIDGKTTSDALKNASDHGGRVDSEKAERSEPKAPAAAIEKPITKRLDGSPAPEPIRKSSIVIKYDIPGGDERAKILIKSRDENRAIGETSFGPAKQKFTELENGAELLVENLAAGQYVVSRIRSYPIVMDESGGTLFTREQRLDETLVDLAENSTATVKMTRPNGRPLSGQVRGLKEKGLASAVVFVSSELPVSRWIPNGSRETVLDVCLTDAEGNFKTQPLSLGTYKVKAVGYTTKDSQDIQRNDVGTPRYEGAVDVTFVGESPSNGVVIEFSPVPFEEVVLGAQIPAQRAIDNDLEGPKAIKTPRRETPSMVRIVLSNGADGSRVFDEDVELTKDARGINLPGVFDLPFARVKVGMELNSELKKNRLNTSFQFLNEPNKERRVLVDVKVLDAAGQVLLHLWDVIADPRTMKDPESRNGSTFLGVAGNSADSRLKVPQQIVNKLQTIEITLREMNSNDLGHIPEHPSKINLRMTVPDAEGRFTVMFENPNDESKGERGELDPEKNQAVFQIHVKDAKGVLQEKIFKQLPAAAKGGYQVETQVPPELFATSTISVTFVTIQPNHDAWVTDFFHAGKKTTYSGMWSGEGGLLSRTALDGGPYAPTSPDR